MRYNFFILFICILLSGAACHKDDKHVDSVAGSEVGFSNPIFQNTPTTTNSTSTTTPTQTTTVGKVFGAYDSRTNGDRPTWRWTKTMASFPNTFQVVFEGCYTVTVQNNGSRWQSGSTVVKQSDGYPGMAALADSSCHSTVAYVSY